MLEVSACLCKVYRLRNCTELDERFYLQALCDDASFQVHNKYYFDIKLIH